MKKLSIIVLICTVIGCTVLTAPRKAQAAAAGVEAALDALRAAAETITPDAPAETAETPDAAEETAAAGSTADTPSAITAEELPAEAAAETSETTETEASGSLFPKAAFGTEPFILYFSGNDNYGDLSEAARSDVNILMTVNPSTRQILLVTTPRDLYVEVPAEGNALDKLTHAGNYGIQASIDTLNQLYQIDIRYYLRMNFTGFMELIDALGGVDVYSDRAFTGEVYHIRFEEGMNHVDGQAALSFVRERHSFGDGDFQRQRNQMELIMAVFRKLMSADTLKNLPEILEVTSRAFDTNVTIADLLGASASFATGSGDWNVQTYGLQGEGVRRSTYSMGSRQLYVVLREEASLEEAEALMQTVLEGGTLPSAEEE